VVVRDGSVHDQGRSVVRVLDASGEVAGAGFLIGPDLVATCAHVVAEAVGADAYSNRTPDRRVRVDLPIVQGAEDAPGPLGAAVLRWSPWVDPLLSMQVDALIDGASSAYTRAVAASNPDAEISSPHGGSGLPGHLLSTCVIASVPLS
jgi:hypothetical protein